MATIEEQLLYSLDTFLDVFTTHDGFFRGYVDSRHRFEKFEDNLRQMGMKFSTRRSRMARDDNDSSGSPDNCPQSHKKRRLKTVEIDSKRLLFHQERGIPITDIGIPFKVVSTSTKHCPFGPTYWGQCAGIPNDLTEKKSQLVFISKSSYKTGCSALYQVKCVRYFPDFRVDDGPEPLKWHKRHKRQQSLTLLKKELAKKGPLPHSFDRYYIEIADTTRHNHCFASSLTHNLHPMIAMQITSLVAEGITDFKEMKERLGEYVSVLNEGGNETTIVYFPSNYFIKKHFNKALEQREHSKKILSALSEKADGDDGIDEGEMISGASINVSHEEVVQINELSDMQDCEIADPVLHTFSGTAEQGNDAKNQTGGRINTKVSQVEGETSKVQGSDASQILHTLSGDTGDGVASEEGTAPRTNLEASDDECDNEISNMDEMEECEMAAQILRTLHGKADDGIYDQPNPGINSESSHAKCGHINNLHETQNSCQMLHPFHAKFEDGGDEEQTEPTTLLEASNVKDGQNNEVEGQEVEDQILGPLHETVEDDGANTNEMNPGLHSEGADIPSHLLHQRQEQATYNFQTLVGQLKANAQLCEDTDKLEKVNDMLGLCSKFLQSGIPLSVGAHEQSLLANFSLTESINGSTTPFGTASHAYKRQGTTMTEDTMAKRVR